MAFLLPLAYLTRGICLPGDYLVWNSSCPSTKSLWLLSLQRESSPQLRTGAPGIKQPLVSFCKLCPDAKGCVECCWTFMVSFMCRPPHSLHQGSWSSQVHLVTTHWNWQLLARFPNAFGWLPPRRKPAILGSSTLLISGTSGSPRSHFICFGFLTCCRGCAFYIVTRSPACKIMRDPASSPSWWPVLVITALQPLGLYYWCNWSLCKYTHCVSTAQ